MLYALISLEIKMIIMRANVYRTSFHMSEAPYKALCMNYLNPQSVPMRWELSCSPFHRLKTNKHGHSEVR